MALVYGWTNGGRVAVGLVAGKLPREHVVPQSGPRPSVTGHTSRSCLNTRSRHRSRSDFLAQLVSEDVVGAFPRTSLAILATSQELGFTPQAAFVLT